MLRGIRHTICGLSVLGALLSGSVALGDSMSWDAYAEFSYTTNTSDSTWQYMSVTDGNNSGYALLANHYTGNDAGWKDSPTAMPIVGVSGNAVWMLPYVSGTTPIAAALAWKSPVTGMVDVAFSVSDVNYSNPIDPTDNGVNYALFKQDLATALYSDTIDPVGSTGTITVPNVPVSAGQKLYFQVGPRYAGSSRDFWWDGTAVTFTVTSVPEPAAIMLVVTGMIGLVVYSWRRQS